MYYYVNNQKHIQIDENKNKEYFLVISGQDKILYNDRKQQCSQYRRQDLQNIVEMDIIR